MKPFQLTGTSPDGRLGRVWACGECLTTCHDEAMAERCCTCHYCGKMMEKDKYGNRQRDHRECRDADWAAKDRERMEKAVEVTDYDGPFLFGDEYCESMDDVVESLDCDECEPEDWPEFIYACKERKPCIVLDLDDLQHKIDDLWEDADWDQFFGHAELKAAFGTFNAANADRAVYHEDRTRKVRIPRPAPEGK